MFVYLCVYTNLYNLDKLNYFNCWSRLSIVSYFLLAFFFYFCCPLLEWNFEAESITWIIHIRIEKPIIFSSLRSINKKLIVFNLMINEYFLKIIFSSCILINFAIYSLIFRRKNEKIVSKRFFIIKNDLLGES